MMKKGINNKLASFDWFNVAIGVSALLLIVAAFFVSGKNTVHSACNKNKQVENIVEDSCNLGGFKTRTITSNTFTSRRNASKYIDECYSKFGNDLLNIEISCDRHQYTVYVTILVSDSACVKKNE